MSIRHFRIFIAVAEEENITKAAKKLYLTQPTVSVAIKEIEEHYGARFFERINQRLHITEEGKRFLDYAKHFIAMYDEMEIAFKNTDFTGRLRIGASVNIGTYYMPRLIREFQDRYPGIKVQVKINTTAVVEKELLDGKLDLALVGGTIQSEHIVAEPLFYEKYPGSLNDISQLQFMLDKASGYGYKKIGFILDRGYFSCENIQYMDKCGYSFVIMVKGMSALVNELILENKGTFENKRVNNIYEYGVYGKTIRHKLYASDKKERYFHLYHSISKESAERIEIENRINQMTKYMKKYQNKVKEFGPGFEKYFNLYYDEKSQAFILPEERCSVVERELDLAGYFCIVTSEKMSAKEAIELYKSRDVSEKLFRGDKSYLGNKSIRVYSEESAGAKIFVEFVAMIVRCKMYIKLKEEMKKLDKKLNYMTVPAAIKELEKIEMVRQLDNIYRLDHAVTANQKVILKAFGLDANSIKYFASELSKELKKSE